MSIREILAQLDAEIALLEKARQVLSQTASPDGAKATAGRKRTKGAAIMPKRKLSAEGRARIAEAQRRRWAAAKKKAAR